MEASIWYKTMRMTRSRRELESLCRQVLSIINKEDVDEEKFLAEESKRFRMNQAAESDDNVPSYILE